jgi:hypothetical protein
MFYVCVLLAALMLAMPLILVSILIDELKKNDPDIEID